jgi:hypothetical protein
MRQFFQTPEENQAEMEAAEAAYYAEMEAKHYAEMEAEYYAEMEIEHRRYLDELRAEHESGLLQDYQENLMSYQNHQIEKD